MELANATFRPMQPEPVQVAQGLFIKLNDISGVLSPMARLLGDFTSRFGMLLIGLVAPLGVLASAVASSALVALAAKAVRYGL